MNIERVLGLIGFCTFALACSGAGDGTEASPENGAAAAKGSYAGAASVDGSSAGVSDGATTRTVKPEDIELTRVEFSDGNYVGWYEPVPGFLLVGESFKYPNASKLKAAEQAVEQASEHAELDLFNILAPERALPQALLDADARRLEYARLAAQRGLPKAPQVSVAKVKDFEGVDEASRRVTIGGVAVAQQAVPNDSACEFEWLRQTYCTFCINGVQCGGSPIMWSFRTGTSEFQKNDKNMVNMAMCSYRGVEHWLVKVQPWFSWSTVVDVTREAGTGWHWSRRNDSTDFDVKSKIDQADGDGYHVCGVFD